MSPLFLYNCTHTPKGIVRQTNALRQINFHAEGLQHSQQTPEHTITLTQPLSGYNLTLSLLYHSHVTEQA